MKDKDTENINDTTLYKLIRKEIGSVDGRRFFARIPALQPKQDLPEQFNNLLARLETAEQKMMAKKTG